jgi:hypothetical protein
MVWYQFLGIPITRDEFVAVGGLLGHYLSIVCLAIWLEIHHRLWAKFSIGWFSGNRCKIRGWMPLLWAFSSTFF